MDRQLWEKPAEPPSRPDGLPVLPVCSQPTWDVYHSGTKVDLPRVWVWQRGEWLLRQPEARGKDRDGWWYAFMPSGALDWAHESRVRKWAAWPEG